MCLIYILFQKERIYSFYITLQASCVQWRLCNACSNVSEVGLDLDSISGPCQAHPYSIPCGRPSLDRPDCRSRYGRSRDGCPQRVILTIISLNPQSDMSMLWSETSPFLRNIKNLNKAVCSCLGLSAAVCSCLELSASVCSCL
jgi:hypothetical protein